MIEEIGNCVLLKTATSGSETDEDQVTQALPESEQLLEALPYGALIMAGDKVTYVNQQLRMMLGYDGSTSRHPNSSLGTFIHKDDLDTIRTYHQNRITHKNAPVEYRFRAYASNGDILLMNCKASRIDWHGEQATLALLSDVTEKVGVEGEKSHSEELFQKVFQMAPEVMLLINSVTSRIVDINPAYLNVFGARRENVVRKRAFNLDIWTDRAILDRFFEELKITSSITDMPIVLKTRGGIVRHFRLFTQAIESASEPMLLIVGRDVTEDVSREVELQRSRDTAELANRTKSEFLANMSHELRTPLNAILGFAEIIRNEIFGPVGVEKYREYSGDIYNSGTHLLSIINDILDLSKVEAGKLEAHLSWIDPALSLDMCVNVLEQRAKDAGVQIVRDIQNDVLLEADDRLVRQICINLLTNAVKFTEEGGKVYLGLEVLMSGDLCLTIQDTGIGMTPAEVKIAKRPFGQVRDPNHRATEGSGLGLPLVSAFAEKLHANFILESERSVGTKASVIFPEFKTRRKNNHRENS